LPIYCSHSSTTVAHRIGNIGPANPTVKSISPNNKRYPHFGLSQFKKNKFSYISIIDEVSDYKFGKPLGFTKAHQKFLRRRKEGVALVMGSSLKFWVPVNISARAEVSGFKFGMQIGFANGHHKIIPRGKMGVALG